MAGVEMACPGQNPLGADSVGGPVTDVLDRPVVVSDGKGFSVVCTSRASVLKWCTEIIENGGLPEVKWFVADATYHAED